MIGFSAVFVSLAIISVRGVHAHKKGSYETKWWSNILQDQKECGLADITPDLKMERTVGGQEAVPGSWPWTVQVILESGGLCGGIVISRDWVLTAAHCFSPVGPAILFRKAAQCGFISVVAGIHEKFYIGITELRPGEQRVFVKDVFLHPKFDYTNYRNDIALLRLKSPLKFNALVQPLCLPSPQMKKFDASDLCVAVGWGQTGGRSELEETFDPEQAVEATSLNQVILPIIDKKMCDKVNIKDIGVDTKKMLCAGAPGKDTCGGDSGGPLACKSSSRKNTEQRWFAVGITSFGDKECVGAKVGVYTQVYAYREWIKSIVRGRRRPTALTNCDKEFKEIVEPFLG